MNRIKSMLVLAILPTMLISCKKGDNQGLDNSNQVPVDYMSTKVGSWWRYDATDGNKYKRAATGTDSFKEGLTYDYYESTDLNTYNVTPEYFGKNGDKYLMLADLGDQTNYLTVVLSKDNPAVGDTWENLSSFTFSNIPLDAKIIGEVAQTGISMSISGKNYQDVIKVVNTLKAKPTGTLAYLNCGTVTIWYCKGIGPIKQVFDINIAGFYTRDYADSLVDYYIEP